MEKGLRKGKRSEKERRGRTSEMRKCERVKEENNETRRG